MILEQAKAFIKNVVKPEAPTLGGWLSAMVGNLHDSELDNLCDRFVDMPQKTAFGYTVKSCAVCRHR